VAGSKNDLIVLTPKGLIVPALIADTGQRASRPVIEFFPIFAELAGQDNVAVAKSILTYDPKSALRPNGPQ